MMNKEKKNNSKNFYYLTEDDIAKLESLHLNVSLYYLKRFYIDLCSLSLSFKSIGQIFTDLFSTSYANDYINLAYLDKLKVFIFHVNSLNNSFRKMIKGDFSAISDIAERNPKVYLILKLLYEINTESLSNFINSLKSKKVCSFELIYFIKELYNPFLYIGLIEWDVQEKLKINTNFNAKLTASEIANNILYALSILTKYSRVKFNHDSGFSSHLFVNMMDSITYILENFLIVFSPLIFRLLGYRKYDIKKERKYIDKALALFFNLSSHDLIEEEEKLVVKKEEINVNDEDKIIIIPAEYKSSALLINLILGVEFYQDQIRYPDYIGELLTKGFTSIARYKSINNQDPLNYAVAYLNILQIFLYEIEAESFEDSSLLSTTFTSLKQLGELSSQIDYFYIKNLLEVRRLFDQNEKAIEQEYIKKMVDELNVFKKQYFFKHYFFVHFTNTLNLSFQLTPIFETIINLYNELERILSVAERRGEKALDNEYSFYKWLDKPMTYKNQWLAERFKQIFPKIGEYDPKTKRNFLYILFNLLKLGRWSFAEQSSFFNSYPTLGFIKSLDTGIAKLNIVESSEFYLYNRLQVELDKFKTLAYVDNLTGCYNKNFLQQQLIGDGSNLNEKANLQDRIVLYIDLDNFKYFNDNYSHETGDIILKEFGKIILKNCRDTDIPIRIGGDEFLVILKSNVIETAVYFSKRIFEGIISLNNYLKSLIELQFSKELDNFVLFSIGASIFEDNLEQTIKQADNLMYSAKKSGKNAIAFMENDKTTILRFKLKEQDERQN